MPEITTERSDETVTPAPASRLSDREFLRHAGIVPDLKPRSSGVVMAVMVVALLLAGATTLAGAMFNTSAPATGPSFEACATSCPGMARPVTPKGK